MDITYLTMESAPRPSAHHGLLYDVALHSGVLRVDDRKAHLMQGNNVIASGQVKFISGMVKGKFEYDLFDEIHPRTLESRARVSIVWDGDYDGAVNRGNTLRLVNVSAKQLQEYLEHRDRMGELQSALKCRYLSSTIPPVEDIVLELTGMHGGNEWHWILRMREAPHWAYATGGCCDTGWDCNGSCSVFWGFTKEEALAECAEDVRNVFKDMIANKETRRDTPSSW